MTTRKLCQTVTKAPWNSIDANPDDTNRWAIATIWGHLVAAGFVAVVSFGTTITVCPRITRWRRRDLGARDYFPTRIAPRFRGIDVRDGPHWLRHFTRLAHDGVFARRHTDRLVEKTPSGCSGREIRSVDIQLLEKQSTRSSFGGIVFSAKQ